MSRRMLSSRPLGILVLALLLSWLLPGIAHGQGTGAGANLSPGFTSLFNGKDLTGWKGLVAGPPALARLTPDELAIAQRKADQSMREHWSVVDGVLTFDGHGTSLVTDRDYRDFELLIDWKIEPGGDSGIYLRGSPQVQIWDNPIGSGGLYNNQKSPSKPAVVADRPVGQWNTFRIVMVDQRVSIWLNDINVADNVVLENYWERDKPIYESGPIELQAHGSVLRFRNIFVREITNPKRQRGALRDTRLDWWRDARFGMFIHWGPVAIKGTEIGWSRGQQVPADEYDRLYEQFEPENFDSAAWVLTAKAAGMKYLVITAKHHDGFCLWDSKYTDYDIMASPYKLDILAELAGQCRLQGIRFCTYYSICDWHHPDYPTDSPGGRAMKSNHNMPRYVQYLHDQTRELISKYGPLGVMWFDGQWEEPWTAEYGDDLYNALRDLQPDLIINNRVGKRSPDQAGTASQNSDNPGDYDTPEQRIGAFNRDRPWETCMTLCRQWAWKPNDQMKSLKECIHAFLKTIGGDGNLLFNVGPMPDGRIEPRQEVRLMEMGRWIRGREQAIYGTRGGPYMPGWWGASTCRWNRVFLFLTSIPDDGVVTLPSLDATVNGARIFAGDDLEFSQTESGLTLTIPHQQRDKIATVIDLSTNRDAFQIAPVDVPRPPSGSVAFGKEASASNVFQGRSEYAAAMAVDDNPETRWATDSGTDQAWLEVDLGRLTEVSRVWIDEAIEFGKRVEEFEIQYQQDGQWRTAHRGTTIGEAYEESFDPVSARRFRLILHQASEGPTIWEFRLFGNDDN